MSKARTPPGKGAGQGMVSVGGKMYKLAEVVDNDELQEQMTDDEYQAFYDLTN